MTQMLRFKAKITPNKTATKTAKKKCFLVFSKKSDKIVIQQGHIINPLLTSFARSVRESNAFGFYRTDLALSSLGLYENLRQYFPVQTSHSVNKSLVQARNYRSEPACDSVLTTELHSSVVTGEIQFHVYGVYGYLN